MELGDRYIHLLVYEILLQLATTKEYPSFRFQARIVTAQMFVPE